MSSFVASNLDFILLGSGIFAGLVVCIFIAVGFVRSRKKKHDDRQTFPIQSAAGAALPAGGPKEAGPTEALSTEVRPTEAVPTGRESKESKVEASLRSALVPTQKNFLGRIKALFVEGSQSSHLDEIEEILYTSDLGPQTVQRLMQSLEEQLSRTEKKNYALVVETLKREMLDIFSSSLSSSAVQTDASIPAGAELSGEIRFAESGPTVFMVVGVNGAGKTTSIGKIAAQMAAQGKKVLVAAGDTFRAAAGQQLKTWTERAQVEIFSPEGVMDPSAVAYDAVAKAKARGYDVVIIDTAGRLHTQVNLMDELKKVKRVVTKVIPNAPHEILVVLDANSGQNALIQAREFNQAVGLTGVILTKMDGTAKGGVAVGITYELKLPIKLVGIGEKIGDLKPFSSEEFVASIFD
jgi:fused signal recognition particle receptor